MARALAQIAPHMGKIKLDYGKSQRTCVMLGQETVMAESREKVHVEKMQTVIYGKFVCIFTRMKRTLSIGRMKRVFAWTRYASIV